MGKEEQLRHPMQCSQQNPGSTSFYMTNDSISSTNKLQRRDREETEGKSIVQRDIRGLPWWSSG